MIWMLIWCYKFLGMNIFHAQIKSFHSYWSNLSWNNFICKEISINRLTKLNQTSHFVSYRRRYSSLAQKILCILKDLF